MVPVGQNDWNCASLSLEHLAQFCFVLSEALKGASARRGRMNDQRSADSIVVVRSEVRVIPVEAVFRGDRESIRKISGGWNWELWNCKHIRSKVGIQ